MGGFDEYVYDLSTGEPQYRLINHEREVNTLQVTKDGNGALAGANYTVRLWNIGLFNTLTLPQVLLLLKRKQVESTALDNNSYFQEIARSLGSSLLN